MEWWIAAGIVLCIFFILDLIRRKRRKEAIEDFEKNVFREDNVNKIIVQFERDLAQNIGLPDGIGNQQCYVYKHLMKNWYKEIIAKNRYNDEMSEKIRIEMVEYITSLERLNKSKHLASKSAGSERAKHEEEGILAKLKVEAIEDGFAAARGPDAAKELEIIRNRTPSEFSQDGECIVDNNG